MIPFFKVFNHVQIIVWLWDHEILALILYSKFIRFIHLMTTETNKKVEHLYLIYFMHNRISSVKGKCTLRLALLSKHNRVTLLKKFILKNVAQKHSFF